MWIKKSRMRVGVAGRGLTWLAAKGTLAPRSIRLLDLPPRHVGPNLLAGGGGIDSPPHAERIDYPQPSNALVRAVRTVTGTLVLR